MSTPQFKIATFNLGFDQEVNAGDLATRLSGGQDKQAQQCAQIIQIVRPDILCINEIDSNDDGHTLAIFAEEYLGKAQGTQAPINYPFRYSPHTNTGVPNNLYAPNDPEFTERGVYGFGAYNGQYGMGVLSHYPLHHDQARTFQHFLWRDKPNHQSPEYQGKPYYADEEWQVMRLSSKNHLILPVLIDNKYLHLVLAHPTPPVFDGVERRNAKRNHDEIELLKDIIEGNHYLYDDSGVAHHSPLLPPFVIAGDLNASTTEGDALQINGVKAIESLLHSHRVLGAIDQKCPNSQAPVGKGGKQKNPSQAYSSFHTTDWRMRADYLIPSSENIVVINKGVFWPAENEQHSDLVSTLGGNTTSSDHRLVWLEVSLE